MSNFPNPWLEIGKRPVVVMTPAVEVPKAVVELAQEAAKKSTKRKPRKSK